MLTGENGVITQASKAKLETRGAEVEERVNLWKSEYISSEYVNTTVISDNELLEEMKKDGILFEEEINRTIKVITIGSRQIDYNLMLIDETPGVLDGEGTEENPYKIQSIEDLVAFSNFVNSGNETRNKFFTLVVNLDFQADSSYVDPTTKVFGDINDNGEVEALKEELTTGSGFMPIGYQRDFEGEFNGNGNTIKNLYIDRNHGNIGLFGRIEYATIENLTVAGEIQGDNAEIGGIVGYVLGNNQISNCISEVNIIANDSDVGGIVGKTTSYGKEIYNCINKGTISLTCGLDNAIGGIIGYGINVTIIDSQNYGKLTIETNEEILNKGNLVGNQYLDSIRNCTNYGEIIVTNNEIITEACYIGGIAGYLGKAVL